MARRIHAWLAAVSLVGLMACGGGGGGGNGPSGAPTDVQATPQEGYVTVTWNYAGEASRFEIFRETLGPTPVGSQQLTLIHTITDPEPPGPYGYDDIDVDPGGTYAYAVAVNGGEPVSAAGPGVSPDPGNTLRILFGSAVPDGADVSITSEPSGIVCGEAGSVGCAASFAAVAQVELTAQAEGLAASWEGCDELAGASCLVSMATDRSVTVSFAAANTLDVDVTPAGTGIVTNQNDLGSSPDVSCDDDCTYSYPPGLIIGLRAEPLDAETYELARWGGACAAFEGSSTCRVEMDDDRAVSAEFQLIPPEILSFAAVPQRISSGSTATISWDVSGGGDIGAGDLDITIEPDIGSVSSRTGSVTVSPSTTTEYTITAANGTATATDTLTVVVGDGPLIELFVAEPQAITPAQTSMLRWTVSGTDTGESPITLTLEPLGIDVTDEGGTYEVDPNTSTTYTLIATNEFGSDSETATVRVGGPPIITSFRASPGAIHPGGEAELTWGVEGDGDVSVSIAPDVGDVTGSTSYFVYPDSDTDYTLRAENEFGSAMDMETVTVGQPAAIASFEASETSITSGESAELSWNVTGDDVTVVLDPPGVTVDPSGSRSVSPDSTQVYALRAESPFGNDSATVEIIVGSAPVISGFSADPSQIAVGGRSTLSWQVSGSGTIVLELDPGDIDVTDLTEYVVEPTESTTYTLRAQSAFGPAVSEPVTVEVVGQAPLITSFAADPEVIAPGGSSTLSWSIEGGEAKSVTLTPGVGQVSGAASQVVAPRETTTYTLRASNGHGGHEMTAEVIVDEGDDAEAY